MLFWVTRSSFHALGWKRINSGKSSSLPANISSISIIFEKGLNPAKLPQGPTSSRPGPILLIVAATAVKHVIRSFPSKERKKSERQNIITNDMK